MKLKSIILNLLVLSFLVVSCKQSTEDKSQTNEGEKLSKEEILKGLEEATFPLPEPMSVYRMLEDIGASYVGDVLNPVESLEKYMITNVKAVNLGVYAADLSYAMVYDKQEDIDKYTKTLKNLIDQLNIKIDYKTLMSEETKEKSISTDSLISVTTNVFYNMYDFLYKESDPSLAALMVNGYYIESLYIATHISEDTFNNIEIVKIIYQQSTSLGDLIELNKKFADNQYIQTLQSSLVKLKEYYDSTDGSLNKEQLNKITTTVEAIRESLIS